MKITGANGPIPPEGWPNGRPDPGSLAKDRARTQDTTAADASAQPRSEDAIHKEHDLRETVSRLIESGDLSVDEDGSVRRARVDDVKRKLEAGTYDRNDIIGGIVDRLLQQWKI